MDKINLEFKVPSNKTIEYNGQTIEIIPFMPLSQQVAFINMYVNTYFGETDKSLVPNSRFNYLEAELGLKQHILQWFTNINIDSLSENIYADSALWDAIIRHIGNYGSFYERLERVVESIKDQFELENSVGSVLSGFIGKLNGWIEKMGDITPEEIEKLQQAGMELAKKLEDNSLLKNSESK
jgi:hypothetical protein